RCGRDATAERRGDRRWPARTGPANRGRRGEPTVSHGNPVWITGVGAATPLGVSYQAIADNLLAGWSGGRAVTGFNVSDHPCQIAGQLAHVPCPAGFDPVEFAGLNRLERLILWCCRTALADAGWWQRRSEIRVGLVLGVGAEWLVTWEADALQGGS